MKARGFKISTPLRRALYASLGMLFVSGVAWLVLHYFFASETDYGVVPAPYEPLTLQIHGVLVPIFMLVFGALFPIHIRKAFKARKNLLTGLCMLSALFVLIATGYLLYYSGNETMRSISSIGHSIIGLAIAPLLCIHIIRGRKISTKVKGHTD